MAQAVKNADTVKEQLEQVYVALYQIIDIIKSANTIDKNTEMKIIDVIASAFSKLYYIEQEINKMVNELNNIVQCFVGK